MRRDPKIPSRGVRNPTESDLERVNTFRRSRTITGSTAPSVRAAGELRGKLQSPRLHEHSLRTHRRRLVVYLGVVLVVSGLLWYVVSSYVGNTVSVTTLRTQSTRVSLEMDRYKGLAKTYLDQRPFERFIFSFNQADFGQYMRSKAPEVSGATLDRDKGLGTATLTVQLREPVVAWTIRGQDYFVDANGEAFMTNYFATPTVVVTDKSGITADAGAITSSKLLRFIGRVITLVNASGVGPVERLELPAESTREVDFKLVGRDYIIKAHLDRDPAGQAADIVSAVNYVQAKGIAPEYVDVRVSSKAYYRSQ